MRGRKLKKLEIQHIRHGVNFTVGIWILRGLLICIREDFFFSFLQERIKRREGSGRWGDSGGKIWKRVGLMYCVGNFVCDAILLSGWICHVQVMDGR